MTKELRTTSSGSAATTRKQVRGDSLCTMSPTTAALTAFPAACRQCCSVKTTLRHAMNHRPCECLVYLFPALLASHCTLKCSYRPSCLGCLKFPYHQIYQASGMYDIDGTCSARLLTCRPQQNDCSEAAKSRDWPCVRVTRMESTTVMVKALLNDVSMSAAMASAVVSTLENPTQTPVPAEMFSCHIHNKRLTYPMGQCYVQIDATELARQLVCTPT